MGTSYVDLVESIRFANSRNEVICVDVDRARIEALQKKVVPIYGRAPKDTRKCDAAYGRLRISTDSPRGGGDLHRRRNAPGRGRSGRMLAAARSLGRSLGSSHNAMIDKIDDAR